MFTLSEANTSDRCKKLKSWYHSTLQESAAKTSSLCSSNNKDESLPDIVNTEQSPLITDDSGHMSDGNAKTTSQPVFSTDELLYEDPGCEEDEIYNWFKGRKISKLRPHQIK